MPFEPLRFIHVTNALVDCQLGGLGGIGPPLDGEIRQLVEDATLNAFERIVSASIEHEVDFLLLVGNSFAEADASLRARTALLRGFARLDESGIRVFVLPGDADPAEAWRQIPALPDNVTAFFTRTSEPVAVLREGKVIASVSGNPLTASSPGDESQNFSAPSEEEQRGPFRIGLFVVTDRKDEFGRMKDEPDSGFILHPSFFQTSFQSWDVDYLALGGFSTRQTITMPDGIAHSPGGTQGMALRESGPHGGTLVEVDADRTVHCVFLPLAPVRWERLPVCLDPQTSQDELIRAMRAALRACRANPAETVCLIQWIVTGAGLLFESLCEESPPQWLIDAIARDPHNTGLPQINHTFRLLARMEQADGDTGGHWLDQGANAAPLAEYVEGIKADESDSCETLLEGFVRNDVQSRGWRRRIESLMTELDAEAVTGEAYRLGEAWFGALSEEESS